MLRVAAWLALAGYLVASLYAQPPFLSPYPNGDAVPGPLAPGTMVGDFAPVAKRASVADQILDPEERKAFLEMFRKRPPAERRTVAEDFLRRFPQSWYLAQAWEITAKACIDLGDDRCALEAARKSLRLLPENPLLLVPLANLQAQLGNTAQAIENASNALDYLERFEAPSEFSARQWTAVESDLRASSCYVIGKAAAEEALKESGSARTKKLQEAERFLLMASRLAPADDRIAYLLGLTRIIQSKKREAGIALAAVYGQNGAFQEKIQDLLQKLYAESPAEGRPAFETFVKQLRSTREVAEAGAEVLHTPPSAYAGAAACRECHEKEHASWERTAHARMLAPYRFENVIGDFSNQVFRDEQGNEAARMNVAGNQHYFQTRGPAGEWHSYKVDYTIGSKWQQTYATRLPNGEIHVFPLQYNILEHRWVAFWKSIDPPGALRGEVSNFYRNAPDTAYVTICAPCHTSQLRKNGPGPATPSNVTFREPGISCETCHGPAAAHIQAMRSAKPGEKAPLQLLEFRKTSAGDIIAICSTCHLQSAVRPFGPNGEIGYLETGDTFFPRYRSSPYPEFLKRAFYKDGRFRVVSFAVEAFIRSACYRKGRANCLSCHDLHPPDPRTNDRGLKAEFLKRPDEMCFQCHPSYRAKPEAHTHHHRDSAASRCSACHMPKIMNTVLFKAMSHQIDEIPDADMTALFGQQDSPNTCLICHEKEDAAWAGAWQKRWYESLQPAAAQ